MIEVFPKNKHPFCTSQKENDNCIKFHKNMDDGFSMCPYGFSCYRFKSINYLGFKIIGYFSDKKINGHEKQLKEKIEMSLFTKSDFLEFINENKLVANDDALKRHEVYRSTIHDIKKVIGFMGDMVPENYENQTERNLADGYALINTRLDYHDRILMKENATTIYGKIKPHKLLKKLSIQLGYKADSKNVKFNFEGNPGVEIYDDSKGIYILFFILLENALKYSLVDSTITISCHDINKYKTSVKIDNFSNYISSDELDKIFDNGYRGENIGQNSGNGIGLWVAKEIMEKNHVDFKTGVSRDRNSKYHFSIYMELPSLDKKGEIYYKE